MIAVIFEFTAVGAKRDEYMELAAALNERVKDFDGFLGIERFQSLASPDRYVSISFWRDEEAVREWRNVQKHREAQARGRGGIFSAYRLRVCQVVRDYTKDSRTQAPKDSVAAHG